MKYEENVGDMSEKSRKDIIECRRYDGKLSEKCRRYLVKYKSLSIKMEQSVKSV